MFKKISLAAVVALSAALPMAAQAESAVTTGPGSPISASAKVNFQITIPRFVFLQVGTGTLLANLGTVDNIVFAPAVAVVGDSTPVAGTGGNLTGGAVSVRVIGNAGSMTLAAVGTPNLTSSGGDTIPWTQITVVAAGGAPAHPTVGSGSVALPATGGVVNTPLAGQWTYSYANSITPAAGTYNGQITYTASAP
jgi:hypothetical protein